MKTWVRILNLLVNRDHITINFSVFHFLTYRNEIKEPNEEIHIKHIVQYLIYSLP